MSGQSCTKCGAELAPDTSFCRSCGAPFDSGRALSEIPTAVLGEKAVAPSTTQRLEARTTSEGDGAAVRTYRPSPVLQPPKAPTSSRRGLMIIGVAVVVLLGVGALVGLAKRTWLRPAKIQVSHEFNYPGSRTIVNLGDEGGAVLQMETTDRFDKVSDWYVTVLKPTKTMRVSDSTLILKNDRLTVTMAATDQGTNIVIKQLAP